MRRETGAILLCVSTALLFEACDRVSWPESREFCGQIQVIDKQGAEILRNAALLLYRTDSNARCCSKAETIAEIKTDGGGNFNAGALGAGKYFLVVKSSPEVVFPMRLETGYDGKKCSLNADFSFDENTGKVRQTVIIKINSDVLPKRTD